MTYHKLNKFLYNEELYETILNTIDLRPHEKLVKKFNTQTEV